MDKKTKIKVLLVDDQPLFIRTLARVIKSRADDIEITGIMENGKQALEAIESMSPDIVILDIKMPVMDGVQTAKIISEEYPYIKVMMLTTFDEDEYVIEALKYGAKGYLLKNIRPEEVIVAIRALYVGINQISPSIIARITEKIRYPDVINENPVRKTEALSSWFIDLTRLEKEILELIVQGHSNKEIALSRNLAEQTVKNYVSNIYDKMNVHKRSQVVTKYMEDKIKWYKS